MFGIAVSRRGRKITYLGQDTPFSTIEATVDAAGPELVVLAVAEGTSFFTTRARDQGARQPGAGGDRRRRDHRGRGSKARRAVPGRGSCRGRVRARRLSRSSRSRGSLLLGQMPSRVGKRIRRSTFLSF